jgi:hypothetical protein
MPGHVAVAGAVVPVADDAPTGLDLDAVHRHHRRLPLGRDVERDHSRHALQGTSDHEDRT